MDVCGFVLSLSGADWFVFVNHDDGGSGAGCEDSLTSCKGGGPARCTECCAYDMFILLFLLDGRYIKDSAVRWCEE